MQTANIKIWRARVTFEDGRTVAAEGYGYAENDENGVLRVTDAREVFEDFLSNEDFGSGVNFYLHDSDGLKINLFRGVVQSIVLLSVDDFVKQYDL